MAQTVASAFANVPASTEKTGLTTAFDSVLTAIAAARADGAFSTTVEGQLKDQVIDVAEQVASNMTEHE